MGTLQRTAPGCSYGTQKPPIPLAKAQASLWSSLRGLERDAASPGCSSPGMPKHPPSRARAAPGPSRLPSIYQGWERHGWLPGRASPCSAADYSHFPACSPSPLSASCLRLLPGFTRAISKRSLEIDFYHLMINIVYGDITAQSSRAEEGGEAGRRTPACSPQLRGAPAGPLLVPIPIPAGSGSAKPRHHPSIRAA